MSKTTDENQKETSDRGGWVDFKDVRSRVSLEDVLVRYYRVKRLKRNGTKLTGPCPVHGGDNPRAFHADLDKQVWHCFTGCGRGGNQLDLVALKDDLTIRDAALRLQEHFLGPETATKGKQPAGRTHDAGEEDDEATDSRAEGGDTETEVAAPEPNPVLSLRLALQGDHPHLTEDRGLSRATTELFGVGYANRGIMRGTIAIPIHNSGGELVAYAGRHLKPEAIREHGKYKFPKGFRKELELYGYHLAMEHLGEGLILVEGFFSVLKLYEAGLQGVVASMGCQLSEYQAALLLNASDVIVMYDGNDAGRRGTDGVRERLGGKVTLRVVTLPSGFEPEMLSPRALRWLVNGMRALNLTDVSLEVGEEDRP